MLWLSLQFYAQLCDVKQIIYVHRWLIRNVYFRDCHGWFFVAVFIIVRIILSLNLFSFSQALDE